MLNIGIDVDGVLTNLEKFQLENGKKYFGETSIVNEKAYDIQDIFGCSAEEREKFWTKYIWKYCLKEKIAKENVEYIKKLKEDGNNIYIITGRAHTTEQNFVGKLFRKMLVKFLDDNDIPYDKILYCDEKNSANEKRKICEQYNIDLMFEDKVENIENLKNYCKIICFNAKYNENYISSDVIRVSNNDFKQAYYEYEKIRSSIKKNSIGILSKEEIEKLTNEEKIEYYKNLKKYYTNLPYDSKNMKKLERNYVLSLKIGMPFFKLICKPIIINKEFIPKDGKCIFVSNHLCYLDQFPIIAAIGNRPIHFMAASTLLKFKRGILYKNTGSIFVDRDDPSSREQASTTMKQILMNDGNVFIFPEGTRNRTEKYLLDFKKGAIAIARDTGATIVPFAINSNYTHGPLIVRAGESMKVFPLDDIEAKTDELRDRIATMVWENMELEQSIERDNKKR